MCDLCNSNQNETCCNGITLGNLDGSITIEYMPHLCSYIISEVPQELSFDNDSRVLTITRGNSVLIPGGGGIDQLLSYDGQSSTLTISSGNNVVIPRETVYIGSERAEDVEFLVTGSLGSTMPGFDNSFLYTFPFADIVVPSNAPNGYKWVLDLITRGGTSAAADSTAYNLTTCRALRLRPRVNGSDDGIADPAGNFGVDTQYMPPTMSISSGANTFSHCTWDNIGQTAGSLITVEVAGTYALQTSDTDIGGGNRRQLMSAIIIWKLYLVKI